MGPNQVFFESFSLGLLFGSFKGSFQYSEKVQHVRVVEERFRHGFSS